MARQGLRIFNLPADGREQDLNKGSWKLTPRLNLRLIRTGVQPDLNRMAGLIRGNTQRALSRSASHDSSGHPGRTEHSNHQKTRI